MLWSTLARNSSVLYGLGMNPCHLLFPRFAVGMRLLMMPMATLSRRSTGIKLLGKQATWLVLVQVPVFAGSLIKTLLPPASTVCERSPPRSNAVGTVAPFGNVVVTSRSPAYQPKNKVLSGALGTRRVPPN